MVVRSDHSLRQTTQVPSIQRDKEIQALGRMVPISRSQKAFAWGAPSGVFSACTPRYPKAWSRSREKDAGTVMDYPTIAVIARDGLAEMLPRPRCRRVRGGIDLKNSTCPNFHHQPLDHSESGSHGNHEIATQHCLSVVSHEGRPRLRRDSLVLGFHIDSRFLRALSRLFIGRQKPTPHPPICQLRQA